MSHLVREAAQFVDRGCARSLLPPNRPPNRAAASLPAVSGYGLPGQLPLKSLTRK